MNNEFKPRYKRGDIVVIKKDLKVNHWYSNYPGEPMVSGWPTSFSMVQRGGQLDTIKCWNSHANAYELENSGAFWTETMLEPFKLTTNDNWKIVIVPYGDKTEAKLYEDGICKKTVSCKKHPDDSYDRYVACDTLMTRLFGEKRKVETPALKPLYNGKVVCVDLNGSNHHLYTVGKIYEFKDGRIITDDGQKLPYTPAHSFNDFNNWSNSIFIEVVE